MARSGADHQVEDVVGVDVAHRYAERALESGERRHRRDRLVAVAVTDPDLGGVPRRSGRRDGIGRDRRDHVDQRHQPVVLVVEPVAMLHIKAGVVVEPGPERQQLLQSLQSSLSSSTSYGATGNASSDANSSFSALLIDYHT